jgi:hypothetical protein
MNSMQEHTVKAFDEDITRLRGLIAEMGGLSEAAIAQSLEALVNGDDELADRVVKADKKIDALESEIDKLAVRIIALRAPMADDLREVIAALKIAGVVERIGDYSKNIAKASKAIGGNRKQFEPLTLLPRDGRRSRRNGPRRADRLCGARCRTGTRGHRYRREGRRLLQFDLPQPRQPYGGKPFDHLERGADAVRGPQPRAHWRPRDECG